MHKYKKNMKRLNAGDIPWTNAHNEVPRKALIKVGDMKTKVQTMNDAKLDPEKSFEPHTHPDCEEIYYFLSGKGEMNVAGEEFIVKEGDCILVEMHESHGLKNIGNEILRFITIRILI